jgi:hypothetical protein
MQQPNSSSYKLKSTRRVYVAISSFTQATLNWIMRSSLYKYWIMRSLLHKYQDKDHE